MASGSEDEQQGVWYFGSNAYDPESNSESEEEAQNMVEQEQQQQDHHKPRLNNELRHLIFQEMLSLKVSDSLPHGTFKQNAQKYGYHHRTIKKFMETSNSNQRSKQAIRCRIEIQKLWKKKSGGTTKHT